MSDSASGTTRANVESRKFPIRVQETDDTIATLSAESQAALRQFSLERTIGYGVDHADAAELRTRVLAGQSWQDAAAAIAQTCLNLCHGAAPHAVATRVCYLRRASALTRISQVMMLSDTDERREIYARACDLYAQAARLAGDREHFSVESDEGLLSGWLVPAGPDAVASAIVIGGVEGWAMDFDSMGAALAARGVDAYLLDAPGQGESRMVNGVYLTRGWLNAFRQVIDEVERRAPGRPIGIVGNSMGGSLAMAVAVADPRIAACGDNGGIATPGLVPPSIGTFFTKMMAFCAGEDADQTAAIWGTVDPTATGPNAGYPLLIVHGGEDPLVSDELLQMVSRLAPTDDQELVVFSDGLHCIYNHLKDRDMVVSDWIRARLGAAATAHQG
ncbi:alpha/beta hydrolase [Rhodococcus sp. NPDC055112]